MGKKRIAIKKARWKEDAKTLVGKEDGAAMRTCKQQCGMWYKRQSVNSRKKASASWLQRAEHEPAISGPIISFLLVPYETIPSA